MKYTKQSSLISKIKTRIIATIQCIKHPWLYPKDITTGLHYVNWGVIAIIRSLNQKAYYWDRYYTRPKNYWYIFLVKLVTFYHDYILALFHCVPSYTLYDWIPKGWRKNFGEELIEKIEKAQAKKKSFLWITDIKEKYGSLRIDAYCNSEIQSIFDYYENKSHKICISCGANAEYFTQGYLKPYCKKCLLQNFTYISINEE